MMNELTTSQLTLIPFIIMGNGVKMLFSIAIGAVVSVVTYLSSRSSNSQPSQSSTNNISNGGPANNSNGSNQSNCSFNRCNGREGFNKFQKSVNEINNDRFVDFLINSHVCLEKFLSIMKSLALSLEYMSRIFSSSNSQRLALPQHYY